MKNSLLTIGFALFMNCIGTYAAIGDALSTKLPVISLDTIDTIKQLQ